jgi:hypothetical protein
LRAWTSSGDKKRRSTGSKRSVPGSVQERDAAATSRLANLERKELEAVEGMQQLGKGAKYDTRGLLAGYVPTKIQRGILNIVQKVRYGPHF